MIRNNEEVLSLRFKICDNLKYDVDINRIVTVYEKQDHLIQKFFRKFKVKIPMYRQIELDEYSSEVFIQIDGNKTVEEIGNELQRRFGEKVFPLYERLLVFLNYICTDCRYIEKVKQD